MKKVFLATVALAAVGAGLVAGIAAGAYAGYRLTEAYTLFYRFPLLHYEIGAGLILWAAAISFAAAAFGAIAAVRKAVELQPAEAMRPPAPARYEAGLLERLRIDRRVPLVGRMIARDIERRPWRAAFTALGIAMSVAILVVGFYFFDAVNYLMRLQFQVAEREDVAVTFAEARSAGSRYDLATLPGVLRVEPFRTVATRLVHGHRSRRVVVLGQSSAGTLRPLVDQDFRIHPLPPEGIVLTSHLAHLLGVRAGGVVTMEVLEGARANGIEESWLAAAQHSPVYKFLKVWKLALPLHPEFGTHPNTYYVPPLSPAPLRPDGSFDEGGHRIPPAYLEKLFGPQVHGALDALRAAAGDNQDALGFAKQLGGSAHGVIVDAGCTRRLRGRKRH